jgi:hypothetical protein
MDECILLAITCHFLNMYRITEAEGVVLHNYGIYRVAQLFGVNDLNGALTPT